jgi:hypothetical protein
MDPKICRKYLDMLSESINDNWFSTGSFETYKKATAIKYQTADKAGLIRLMQFNP